MVYMAVFGNLFLAIEPSRQMSHGGIYVDAGHYGVIPPIIGPVFRGTVHHGMRTVY